MPSAVLENSTYSTNGVQNGNGQLKKQILGGHHDAKTQRTQPLKYTGSLDRFDSFEVTPAIGREFRDAQIADVISASNSDDMLRDFAYTVSSRGVVFFRNQDVTPGQMKKFIERLSKLAGAPESSSLHVHPLTESGSELGDQVSVISSAKQKKGGGLTHQQSDSSRLASVGWHADITFEPVPSDYAMLKIHTLPGCGGDTLWSSGYEIYDRLSPVMASMLEGLTATHDATFFHDEARRLGQPLRDTPRGHPLNVGTELTTTHPVIRTNPVTGWKSVFVNKGFTKRINGVTKDESDMLLKYLFDLIVHNHDAQVRFRWNKNDVAIWDNRSVWHTATYDIHKSERAGDRVCSLGEAPYLDLASTGRREAEEAIV